MRKAEGEGKYMVNSVGAWDWMGAVHALVIWNNCDSSA